MDFLKSEKWNTLLNAVVGYFRPLVKGFSIRRTKTKDGDSNYAFKALPHLMCAAPQTANLCLLETETAKT